MYPAAVCCAISLALRFLVDCLDGVACGFGIPAAFFFFLGKGAAAAADELDLFFGGGFFFFGLVNYASWYFPFPAAVHFWKRENFCNRVSAPTQGRNPRA